MSPGPLHRGAAGRGFPPVGSGPARPVLTTRLLLSLAAGAVTVALATGCAAEPAPSADDAAPAAAGSGLNGGDSGRRNDGTALSVARSRAVSVATTACGHAPATAGSGVAISQNRVLTAAHVIAGATVVTVGPVEDHGRSATATVVAYDPLRDLALLEADLAGWSVPSRPPALASLAQGDRGTVVGAVGSGATGSTDVAFTVAEKTNLVMDEVRGTRRSKRSGYRLDAVTAPGDSGSGLYGRDGRLAGVLFAVSTDDGDRSWATAADEVEAFLADESVVGRFGCDNRRSRLERRRP